VGWLVPNSAIAWRACSRNCSPVMPLRDEPMIWYLPGIRPSAALGLRHPRLQQVAPSGTRPARHGHGARWPGLVDLNRPGPSGGAAVMRQKVTLIRRR
jgi:hypothetical protein